MSRLPIPGQDSGTWGDILNDYLSQSLAASGQLKPDSVGSTQLQDNAVTSNVLAPNSVTNAALASNAVNATIIADGSITEALLDTALQTKVNQSAPVTSVNAKTGAVSLTKTDIGLDQVDNTSDAAKNSAAATLTNKTLDNTNSVTVKTANFFVQATSDTTKQMKFVLDGVTSGNVRQLSVPDANTTIVGIDTTQTLTNKTLTTPKISRIMDTNGNVMLDTSAVASAVNYVQAFNAATGGEPGLIAAGSDASINLALRPKGAGGIYLRDSSGVQIASFAGVSSAVNRIRFTSAATGTAPTIAANGTDTNVDLNLTGQGTGAVKANSVQVADISSAQTLTNKTLTTPQIDYIKDASGNKTLTFVSSGTDNYLQISARDTSSNPSISAQGTSTNLHVVLTPKGTGALQIYEGAGQTMASINSGGTATDIDLNLGSKGAGVVKANGLQVATVSTTAPAVTNGAGNRILDKTLVNLYPESPGFVVMPMLFNDLAFNNLRGGSVTVTKNGTTLTSGTDYNPDNWFANQGFTAFNSVVSTDIFVITVTVNSSVNSTYNNHIGLQMSDTFMAKDITIEVQWNGTWVSILSLTNQSTANRGLFDVQYGANNAYSITAIRYTLGNMNSSSLRISSLFLVGYASPMLTAGFLPRGGGALYGTNANAPILSASGGDANIDLGLSAKGTGNIVVKQNGDTAFRRIATILTTPPATATSTGIAGQTAYDANYFYICTATNTWKRSALSSW